MQRRRVAELDLSGRSTIEYKRFFGCLDYGLYDDLAGINGLEVTELVFHGVGSGFLIYIENGRTPVINHEAQDIVFEKVAQSADWEHDHRVREYIHTREPQAGRSEAARIF